MKNFIVLVAIMSIATLIARSEEPWMKQSLAQAEQVLVTKYGEQQRARIQRGLKQVASFWRAEDGTAETFNAFVESEFAGTPAAVDTLFTRYEHLLEKLDGHMAEIGREFRVQADLQLGPMEPYDDLFAGFDPGAHLTEDMFSNKLAFVVLLNFPLTTLDQRLAEGAQWTRRQWAETRLAHRFAKRVPASVNQAIAAATAQAEKYIADYNIYMHHLVDPKGTRLFPAGMRLLSHWNLRDEIKADYADAEHGLAKQRQIQQVMERIVTQTIPAVVVNNPGVDWDPVANTVSKSAVNDAPGAAATTVTITAAPEPDTRYATLLATFTASAKMDPYSPTAPTLIARRFDENREIPEQRVKKILEAVLTSPHVKTVAELIRKRLGRPLEPFDIWYNGFTPKSAFSEAQLDEKTRKAYPTPEAYQKDIPRMLRQLGFDEEFTKSCSSLIAVDPARGSGHAMGAAMRGVPARLRTRVEPGGMNYKGYNIAVHEMGHNVEQFISLNLIDHTLLQGVPNTAFTEALAFVFQGRDRELLGLPPADADGHNAALVTLNDFWMTYEIAGVALVDMAAWHWMYDHPTATPAELKAAVLRISQDTWNMYYAPVFKKKDVVLLGIYSHMIHSFLYLPDYPLGHLIAFQIEQQVKKSGSVGPEFMRMARQGSIAPDLWMQGATGHPVGPEALLEATAQALKSF
jgi:hypothetical protein